VFRFFALFSSLPNGLSKRVARLLFSSLIVCFTFFFWPHTQGTIFISRMTCVTLVFHAGPFPLFGRRAHPLHFASHDLFSLSMNCRRKILLPEFFLSVSVFEHSHVFFKRPPATGQSATLCVLPPTFYFSPGGWRDLFSEAEADGGCGRRVGA